MIKKSIRLAQWNVQACRTLDDGEDPTKDDSYSGDSPSLFSDQLFVYDPDIITIQELHVNDQRSQAEEIADSLDLRNILETRYGQPSFLNSDYDMSQAVISRLELTGARETVLEHQPFKLLDPSKANGEYVAKDTTVSSAVVMVGGSAVRIATLHMQPFGLFDISSMGEEASEIRDALKAELDSFEEDYWVLQADFNANMSDIRPFLGYDPDLDREIAVIPFSDKKPRQSTIPVADEALLGSKVIDHVAAKNCSFLTEGSKTLTVEGYDYGFAADHKLLISTVCLNDL